MIVEEGSARIYVEHVNERGPGKIQGVFYNREMVFNRDSSIFVLSNLRVRNAVDALGATGVRGIRIIKEVGIDVTINDVDPRAVELIRKNLLLNRVNARVTNRNANSLLAEERFDYVDIDPFGSPVPFLDIALQSARYLGVSATDTATLSGRNGRIVRRYLAKIDGNECLHEIGIRVLLGYIARMAARFDLGIRPVLSFWRKHAYRVYVRIIRGSSAAKKTLNNVKTTEIGGPLWIGELHDFDFLRAATVPEIPSKLEFEKMLSLWKNEKFFLCYEIPKLCSTLKIPQPPLSDIITSLRERGYEAYRTHFSQQGIKTNANLNALSDVMLSIKRDTFDRSL